MMKFPNDKYSIQKALSLNTAMTFTDLETVESQRNDLIPEEFPEGPYGTSLNTESLGKSTPWRKDQRPTNQFSYENRELHEGIKRDYPRRRRLSKRTYE